MADPFYVKKLEMGTNDEWFMLTGKVEYKRHPYFASAEGPVLNVEMLELVNPLDRDITTFV